MKQEFGEVAFLQSPKSLEKLKKIMPDKKTPYNTEAVQQIIKKMSQAKNDDSPKSLRKEFKIVKQIHLEAVNQAKSNIQSSYKQLNYNQLQVFSENFKNFGQSARSSQGTLKNNLINRMSGKDEQLQNENFQAQQVRLKNNSAFFPTGKNEQSNGTQIPEEPQLSHRGQHNDGPLKFQQKTKQQQQENQYAIKAVESVLSQNNQANIQPSQNANFVSQNFIQMLQINAQRKNKQNQNGPTPAAPPVLTNQNINNAVKNYIHNTNNTTTATTSATAHTSTQFYALDEQQNNIMHQIFASSAGFNSPNSNFTKKINPQLTTVTSTKVLNQHQKKLFDPSASGNLTSSASNSIQLGQQKKSNSLQRQINNSKHQANQQQLQQSSKHTQSNEYFSKIVSNNKLKEFSQTETTPKQDQDLYSFQDGLLYSNQLQYPQSQMNNMEKIEIEKEVEEEYLNNIKQINKDIIQKKKFPEDPTNQFLNFIPKPTNSTNQFAIKNDSNLMRKSTEKKNQQVQQMFLTQQQLTSSYNQDRLLKSNNEQPSSAKKTKQASDKFSQSTYKKRESFEVGAMTRTGNDFYKSNSLNKNDKKSSLNLLQSSQKRATAPPMKSGSAQVKKSESPLKSKALQKQQPKSGIKNIFSSSVKGNSSMTSSTGNYSKTVSAQMSKEIKNKQQLEQSLKALASINQTTSAVQSKKQSDEIQSISSPSQQESPYQTGLSQYVSQVRPQQMQQYLSYPRNDHVDKIDNIDVELKLSKRSSMNGDNRSSQNDKALQLSDLESSQPDFLHRKNRIETPISLGFCYYNTSMDMHNRYPNPDDYFCNIFREHFVQSFNALNFCRQLEPIDPLILETKLIELPLNPNKKKTIIFDLDETLIHCNEDPNTYSDVMISVTFPNGELVQAGINIRPYAKECLRELSKQFEIIVFTASHSCYAERVIDYLDPNRQYIDCVLSRDNCVQTKEGVHIKDLRIFKNRDLKNLVIVDNAAYSFGFQIENGIPIIPFFDNKRDMELKFLTDFLKRIQEKDDVRTFLHKTFKMNIYQECESVEEALERVYGIKQPEQLIDIDSHEQRENEIYQQQQNNQYSNQMGGELDDEDDDLERDEADDFEDQDQEEDQQTISSQYTQQMQMMYDNNNNNNNNNNQQLNMYDQNNQILQIDEIDSNNNQIYQQI